MAVERHVICKVNDIPDGEGKSFNFNDISVAIFRVGEKFLRSRR